MPDVVPIETGIYYDMDDDTYFADPAVSQSGVRRVSKGDTAQSRPRYLVTGSALDCKVFTPQLFDGQFCVLPNKIERRKKIDKERIANFETEHGGATALQPAEMDDVNRMYEALRRHSEAVTLLANRSGNEQVCVFADLAGVHCKGKIDKQIDDPFLQLVDLKSTYMANVLDFQQSVVKYWYDVQAAFYMDLWEVATGKLPCQYSIVAVSSRTPYPVWVTQITDQQQDAGRRQYQSLLAVWSKINGTSSAGCQGSADNRTTEADAA